MNEDLRGTGRPAKMELRHPWTRAYEAVKGLHANTHWFLTATLTVNNSLVCNHLRVGTHEERSLMTDLGYHGASYASVASNPRYALGHHRTSESGTP